MRCSGTRDLGVRRIGDPHPHAAGTSSEPERAQYKSDVLIAIDRGAELYRSAPRGTYRPILSSIIRFATGAARCYNRDYHADIDIALDSCRSFKPC